MLLFSYFDEKGVADLPAYPLFLPSQKRSFAHWLSSCEPALARFSETYTQRCRIDARRRQCGASSFALSCEEQQKEYLKNALHYSFKKYTAVCT